MTDSNVIQASQLTPVCPCAAQIVEATVIRPGDKLIIRLGDADMMTRDRFAECLAAALGPAVPFVVIGGDIKLVVMRQEVAAP